MRPCFPISSRLVLTRRRRLQDLDKQMMHTTPIGFYDFFLNRIVVNFKPKFEMADPLPEFELTLSKKNTYDQVRPSSPPPFARSDDSDEEE